MTKLNEALEKSLARAQHKDKAAAASAMDQAMTSTFYRGVLLDYITCQECGYSRKRTDVFTDVPLAVAGVESIEQALALYSTPDILTGGDRWYCERCDTKVDALKGLGFKELPHFLNLQLKRFAYDPQTWRRIKLNDKVSFPTKLDMTSFLHLEEGSAKPLEHVYDLFSVMIHSGGAMGGHYFAYIKSFDTGKWMKFNDASGTRHFGCAAFCPLMDCPVSVVEESEIELMFGGAPPLKRTTTPAAVDENGDAPAPLKIMPNTAAGGFSTNAYMLVYRRCDPSSNVSVISDSEIPPVVRLQIEQENEDFRKEKAEYIKRRDAIYCTVWYSSNPTETSAPGDLKTFEVPTNKHQTLEQLLAETRTIAERDGVLSEADRDTPIRVRPMNVDTKTRGTPWTLEDLKAKLCDLKFSPSKNLFLEKQIAGIFPGDDEIPEMVLKIVRYEPNGDLFAPPVEIKLKIDATLLDLKQRIERLDSLRSIPIDQQRLFFLSTQDAAKGLPKEIISFGPKPTLEELRTVRLQATLSIFDGATLHLEPGVAETPSAVIQKFEEQRNKIQLFYNHPDSRELNLEIFIDKRKSVLQLKNYIAELVGLSIGAFKLCNGLLAKEFREEQKALDEVGLYDGSAVFLQKGKPISSDKTKLTVYLLEEAVEPAPASGTEAAASAPAPGEKPSASVSAPILALREILSELVEVNLTLGVLRTHILAVCGDVLAISDVQDPKRLRIREKRAGRAASILANRPFCCFHQFSLLDCFCPPPPDILQDAVVVSKIGASGVNAQPRESVELFLQVLSQPEVLRENEMILDVRRWFPQQQKLAERAIEVVLPRDATIFQLKSMLAGPNGTHTPHMMIVVRLRTFLSLQIFLCSTHASRSRLDISSRSGTRRPRLQR